MFENVKLMSDGTFFYSLIAIVGTAKTTRIVYWQQFFSDGLPD